MLLESADLATLEAGFYESPEETEGNNGSQSFPPWLANTFQTCFVKFNSRLPGSTEVMWNCSMRGQLDRLIAGKVAMGKEMDLFYY